MTVEELLADPKALATAVALAASGFSTLHTFLDKHPRLQAALRFAAHFVGPLNLPAMRNAAVNFCLSVAHAEEDRLDAKAVAEHKASAESTVPATAAPTAVKGWPQS